MIQADRLGPEEAHLFYVLPDEVKDPALLLSYEALMTPEERARRDRFHFARDRHLHLVTRALVRTVLSRYAGVDPRAWVFASGPQGKPEIAAPAGFSHLRFNLSHTEGLVACLLGRDRAVGVDAEDTTRAGQTVEIADRFFSPAEVADLSALPAGQKRARFFEYWTLKESYIKARGLGLSLPLDQFSFHLDGDAPIRISFDPRLGDDPARWHFGLHRPTPRHLLALAIERRGGPVPRVRMEPIVPPA